MLLHSVLSKSVLNPEDEEEPRPDNVWRISSLIRSYDARSFCWLSWNPVVAGIVTLVSADWEYPLEDVKKLPKLKLG